MVIRIKNLQLRAIVGTNDWERKVPREIIANIEIEFDGAKAAASDDLQDSIDYSDLAQRLLAEVGKTDFFLLEKLVTFVLNIVMAEPLVKRAVVEVEKPHALSSADSVSLTASAAR